MKQILFFRLMLLGFCLFFVSNLLFAHGEVMVLRTGLKGKVKTLKITCYKASGKIGHARRGAKMYFPFPYSLHFDKQGNMLKRQFYDYESGRIKSKSLYKYGKSNQVIEELRYRYDRRDIKNPLESKTTYKYNRLDSLIERNYIYYPNLSSSGRNLVTYNDKGHKLSERSYIHGDECFHYQGYTYDKEGRLIEHIYGRSWRDTFKYDTKGNMIERCSYDVGKPNVLNWKSIYAYDTEGHKISEFSYDNKGKCYKKKLWYYNNQGHLDRVLVSGADGSLIEREVYRYNKMGDVISYTDYNAVEEKSYNYTCEYAYDKQGNWIKEVQYFNGVAERITEAVIIYYK